MPSVKPTTWKKAQARRPMALSIAQRNAPAVELVAAVHEAQGRRA